MDDAFMFYALAQGKVRLDGLDVEHVIADIQTLNERARTADLDITAVSVAAYPAIAKDYWVLGVGSSVGEGYGPLVVAKRPLGVEELKGCRVAVPGLQTTAYLALCLAVDGVVPVVMSFETIPEAVLNGQVEAGLLIHERQLTYRDQGLLPILDLGTWWKTETHLPLPLGVNAVKRSLGKAAAQRLAQGLKDSILWAMTHQDEVIQACLHYGRGIDAARARQFVGMYVNEETLLLSRKSRKAIRELYRRAAIKELLTPPARLTLIDPPDQPVSRRLDDPSGS
jgi:1,4-dihydroxy-6-naphthoate synthase